MITKIYIKMCRKAKEIQKLWVPGLGDICINKVDNKEVMVIASRGKIADKEYKFVYLEIGGKEQPDYWHKKDKLILLPTQRQLQEMMMPILGDDFIGCAPLILNERLRESLFSNGIYNWGKSYNELWLTFVMKEKYNKIWDRGNWQIKEDKVG